MSMILFVSKLTPRMWTYKSLQTVVASYQGQTDSPKCNIHLSLCFFFSVFIFQTLQMDINKLNITLLRIFRQGVAAALGLLPQQVHINRLIVRSYLSHSQNSNWFFIVKASMIGEPNLPYYLFLEIRFYWSLPHPLAHMLCVAVFTLTVAELNC